MTEARKVIEAFADIVIEAVARDERVTLTGFGTFEAYVRQSTERLNPRTGEELHVPARRVPKFRPGKRFKEAMLQGEPV